MGLGKKARNFYNYPPEFKRLLGEALIESLKNEFFLKANTFGQIRELHQNADAIDKGAIPREEILLLRQVSKAMNLLEKFAPWRPKCYNRALTAKRLLERRDIKPRLHIGFRKKDGEFDGHAWITYCGKFITGRLPGIRRYNELRPVAESNSST